LGEKKKRRGRQGEGRGQRSHTFVKKRSVGPVFEIKQDQLDGRRKKSRSNKKTLERQEG